MSRQIIILAAGKGTRMASALPKVLIPLRDKPLIKHLLSEVAKVPQKEPPIVVVGFEAEKVKAELGPQYIYAEQKEQLGSGHAVLSAKDCVTADNIIVLYGDMPFIGSGSLEELINLHEHNQKKISMFTATVPNFEGIYSHFLAFGRIIRDSRGSIVKIREYSDADDEEKAIREINPGIYMFDAQWLWKHLPEVKSKNAQGEYYLTDIIEIAIADGQSIASLPIAPEEIFGINTPEHLSHAQTLIND